jgi:formate dehydrogenase maturation protein FdhE
MTDKSLKYSEEYIRLRVKNLKKDYRDQVSRLQTDHDEGLQKWKKETPLKKAFEAAYDEELENIKKSFLGRIEEIRSELSALKAEFKSVKKEFIANAISQIKKIETALQNFSKAISEDE